MFLSAEIHLNIAFFKSSIKKNHLKLHSLVIEVNEFEFRVTYFTRSNNLNQRKNYFCGFGSYRVMLNFEVR